ncbi:MAG: ferrochelatase [bacterium]
MGHRSSSVAVLLLNMGGPDSLQAVKPFLENLFTDPVITGLPRFLCRPLAAVLSSSRAKKVTPRYDLIGGRSPLNSITKNQCAALESELTDRGLDAVSVRPALRYWNPFISEVATWIREKEAERIVALSLYPQFCRATSGTCLDELEDTLSANNMLHMVEIIDRWPVNPGYIRALAGTITEALESIPEPDRKDAVILFSAHGIPQSLIRKGDPYLAETTRTVESVMKVLGDRPNSLAFQSRLGPVRWLEPSLSDVLTRLASNGKPPIVIVPVSFVSDNIETLYELDIKHKEIAESLGIKTYVRAPALNTRPDFIEALADLVLSSLG